MNIPLHHYYVDCSDLPESDRKDLVERMDKTDMAYHPDYPKPWCGHIYVTDAEFRSLQLPPECRVIEIR